MARRAKEESSGGDSAVRSNGYDPEAVRSFCERVENLEVGRDFLKAKHKGELEPFKVDIDQVIAEANKVGIPKKELKKVLKRRAVMRKLDAEREKLNSYEQTNYDNLRLALGAFADLPLGQAAMAGASASV